MENGTESHKDMEQSIEERLPDTIEHLARRVAQVIRLGMANQEEAREMLAYLAELRTFYRGAILAAEGETPESAENARAELKGMIRILGADIDFAAKRISSSA